MQHCNTDMPLHFISDVCEKEVFRYSVMWNVVINTQSFLSLLKCVLYCVVVTFLIFMAIFGQSLVTRSRDVTCRSCASLAFVLVREPGGVHAGLVGSSSSGNRRRRRRRAEGEGRRRAREGERGVLPRQREESEYRSRRGLNERRLSKQEITLGKVTNCLVELADGVLSVDMTATTSQLLAFSSGACGSQCGLRCRNKSRSCLASSGNLTGHFCNGQSLLVKK